MTGVARKAVAVAVGLAVLVVGYSVASGPSPALTALQADPMANVVLETGTEVRRSEGDEGTTLGKPVYARILLRFAPVEDRTDQQVFDELEGLAEASGWELQPAGANGEHRSGAKQVDGRDLSLFLNIAIDGDVTVILD